MKKAIVIAFLLIYNLSVDAQEKSISDIHAAFINNFMKYVQWPNEADGGDFVIGVYGDDAMFNTLKSWHDGRSKGTKKIVLKNMTSVDDAAGCSIIFLSKSNSRKFDALKTIVAGKPILTITDGYNLGARGSCFNFTEVDGRLKFELNQAAFKAATLKVSSQLLTIAIVI